MAWNVIYCTINKLFELAALPKQHLNILIYRIYVYV